MSDYEDDFIDVQSFSNLSFAESLGGAYRAEATDQWTASSGITFIIPPLFDWSTSWFKKEERTDYWLDLTQLEAGKRGPALNNRHVGDASMYKGLPDREPLRSEDGVKYFKKLWDTTSSKELWVFSSGDFFKKLCVQGENMGMVKWIGKISSLLKHLKESWMDMLPTSSMSETRRQNQYHADVAWENEERRSRSQELLFLDLPKTREEWCATQVAAHEGLFPFSDNLTPLMFTVASYLSEAQR